MKNYAFSKKLAMLLKKEMFMKRIVRNFLILFLCVCAIVPISVSKSPERIEASELKDAASIGKVHPDDIVYVGMNYNSGRESCWMKLKWKRILKN